LKAWTVNTRKQEGKEAMRHDTICHRDASRRDGDRGREEKTTGERKEKNTHIHKKGG
jgi:hypothetical protein